MSVSTAQLKYAGLTGPIITPDRREYRREYLVVTTNYEDEIAVLSAVGLPALGSPFPSDAGALCSSARAKPDAENEQVWTVEVEWSTQSRTGNDPAEDRKPPTERAAKFRLTFVDEVEYPLKDINGKPYLNSAGVRFTSIPPLIRSYPCFEVVKNLAALDFGAINALHGCVNEDVFMACAPGTLKARISSAESQYEQGQWFWQVSYGLVYKFLGWDPIEILDAGKEELAAAAGGADTVALTPILDRYGNPVSSDWPLDGEGHKLSAAQVAAGNVVYLKFSNLFKTNFGNKVPLL